MMLCILGVVPIILSETLVMMEQYGVIQLFCMVSLAVFLFVRTGIVNSSFNILLQKEDYIPENKEFSKKVGPVEGVHWCLATAIFLAIDFLQEDQGWANAVLV